MTDSVIKEFDPFSISKREKSGYKFVRANAARIL
jgi:hypothetical protein